MHPFSKFFSALLSYKEINIFAPTNRCCELLVILRMLVAQNYTPLDDYLVQMFEETDEPEVEPNDLFTQRFNIIAVEKGIDEEHIYSS